MICSSCGEVCHCLSEPPPTALSQWIPDAEILSAAAPSFASDPVAGPRGGLTEPAHAELVLADSVPSPAASPASEDDASAWRDELSTRLNRYRSRRKIRPPRYPSLALQFDAIAPLSHPDLSITDLSIPGSSIPGSSRTDDPQTTAPYSYEPAFDRALALNEMQPSPTPVTDVHLLPEEIPPRPVASSSTHVTAKIIEFPRFAWGPPAPSPDQLAEPVTQRPRILEVPEVVPPPPALGGITIEPAQRPEEAKRPGIDIPLQSASLARRVAASAIDAAIVAVASVLFGAIFWKVAAVRPPLAQILGLSAGIFALFWAAYQYLLIVYSATTPGLRIAGLELARFSGAATSRPLRRWRVLAACLSAASLGMGYAWVFLDEDALCWHDRITHTYLAPKGAARVSS